MARLPVLTFDRGTLILHPPPRGRSWIDFAVWDDRIEKFRIPASQYRSLVERLRAEGDQTQADLIVTADGGSNLVKSFKVASVAVGADKTDVGQLVLKLEEPAKPAGK